MVVKINLCKNTVEKSTIKKNPEEGVAKKVQNKKHRVKK